MDHFGIIIFIMEGAGQYHQVPNYEDSNQLYKNIYIILIIKSFLLPGNIK